MKDRHRHLTKGSHDQRHQKSRHAVTGNLSNSRWPNGAHRRHRHSAHNYGYPGARGWDPHSDRQGVWGGLAFHRDPSRWAGDAPWLQDPDGARDQKNYDTERNKNLDY